MMLNVAEAVKDFLEAQKREYRPRTPGEYWPTEVPKCLRQWYFEFTTPGEFDLERQGVFTTGFYVEQFIAAVLEAAVKDKNVDIVIPQRSISLVIDDEEDVMLNGKADFLVLLKSRTRKESQLLEIKSTNSVKYLDAPNFDHVVQIMPYIKVLKPDTATILYVDRKNYSQVKQFDVEYDPAIMAWIKERTKKQDKSIKRAELPIAEARYCRKCWKAKLVTPSKERLKELGIATRSKMVECPNCKWVGKMDESELYRCGYCPFKTQCFAIEGERDKVAELAPEPESEQEKD